MHYSQQQPAAHELLAVQRDLRERLLEDDRLHACDRELAAEMLLYLDDPRRCWEVCTGWLVRNTCADRVDGGFASREDLLYSPMIESQRIGLDLPTVIGASFDARDGSIMAVWNDQHAVLFADACSDDRIGPRMRSLLSAAGTRSKVAVALRNHRCDVGLLCADSRKPAAWTAGECERLNRLAKTVISPILHAARQLQEGARDDREATPAMSPADAAERALTRAELDVARLVVAGLSYKEIARQLEKSCSTIDHQLRSIRAKVGVHSTAMLVRELSQRIPAPLATGVPEPARRAVRYAAR